MSIGNVKSEGSKGTNFNWQLNVLNGLQKGADNTNGLIGVLTSILNATVAHQDMEILLVRDKGNGDQIVQQIREYDETSQTWSTTYSDISGAAYTPVGPLEYLDPSAVLNLILTELLDQGLTLDDIELNTDDVATQTTLQALLTAFNAEDFATEATLAVVETNTTGVARTPGIIRPTTAGNVNTAAPTFYSVSVANVGLANGTVLGATIKPGEVLNFSGDALNNFFTSFDYDATGTEFLITFIY
jgi:hypothetical protein